jgi:glycosyltransferase involved in cell wall biosynthesis
MELKHINHVLSTWWLSSRIFADLIRRDTSLAAPGMAVTSSVRPKRGADVHHYHRPNLENRLRPTSVATVHHDLRETARWLALPRFLARYREARLVHCLNRTQQAILHEHDIAHTELIPHGVDRIVFPVPQRPRLPVPGKLRLGFISRRYDRGVKGEALLEALLHHLDPARVSFVFVGRGRWREARIARGHGFRAESYERLPYRLLGEVYRRIDALLILSEFEGGPASLPEALGSGVPVIATAVGMCADLVEDNCNGLLLRASAAIEAERIMSLLDDGATSLARLMRGAFATAPSIQSWEAVLALWRNLHARAAEG